MSSAPIEEPKQGEEPPRPVSVPFGIVLVLVGVYIWIGHTLVTGNQHWLMPVVGVIVICVGLSYIAPALGEGGKIVDQLTVACVVLAFNYVVFVNSLDWLRSVGGSWGPRLARIAVVAVDLYLAFWIASRLLRIKAGKLAGFAGAVLVAIGLHAAGVLDRLNWTSVFLAPASSGILEARRTNPSHPQLPYGDFAGNWRVSYSPFGASWINRVEIQVKGDKASVKIWRLCGKQDCDAGTYDARFERGKAGQAHALHFGGNTAGYDWLAALVPGTQGMMFLSERRIRGSDWNTHSQQMPHLKRIP